MGLKKGSVLILLTRDQSQFQPFSINSPHAPIMARINRLCQNMSSNSVTLINRKKKSGRSVPIVESRYRKRLIIIDHSGHDTTELELFLEHDKVYDGTVMILSHYPFLKTLFPSFLHHVCLQFLYPTNFLVRECFSLLVTIVLQ